MSDSTKEQRALIRSQARRADTLPTHLLECRVGGSRHRWDRVKPLFQFEIGVTHAYQCDRCLTIKHTCTSPKYGERLRQPVYLYPEGYELERPKNGERVMSPNAVRVTLADRVNWDSLPEATPLRKEEGS